MKYLLSPSGIRVLTSLCFTNTLYAFDFDGTLAPIVEKPEDAVPARATEALLKELSELSPVAVISGRSIADLKSRLRFTPSFLIGNHGVEGLPRTNQALGHAEQICQIWRKQVERNWPKNQFDSGVSIEDKVYSLALHYRRSRNKKEDRVALFHLVEKLDPPPRLILGKSVINLLPPGAPHKGMALLEILMQLELKSAFYIGDDDTDEDVFSLPDSRIFSARVGQRKTSQAQYYLKRQTEINSLLKLIIQQLRKSSR